MVHQLASTSTEQYSSSSELRDFLAKAEEPNLPYYLNLTIHI